MRCHGRRNRPDPRVPGAIAVLVAAFLLAAAPKTSAQQLQTLEGVLNVVWGDPRPGEAGGGVLFSLAQADGTIVPLDMAGLENAAIPHFQKHVAVTGRTNLSAPPAGALVSAPARMAVETIAPLEEPQADAATSAVVSGTRGVIFLMLRFPDDASVPHTGSFYTNMTNPYTPPSGSPFPTTINGFFDKTSWGQFHWSGAVGGVGGLGAPGGWLTLPHPRSYYASCGWSGLCAELTKLGDDATALARAQGIVLTGYSNINFVLSNDLDCCAWGGSYYSIIDGKSYGATWEPPWGQDTTTYSHEMGHSIGLAHSGWVYYAYDSPWDVMSDTITINAQVCGSYVSGNSGMTLNVYCGEPGDGYIAPYKDYLGWIPAANEVVLNAGASATVTLESDAAPLGSATKMVKICLSGYPCTGSSARYYTVEARVKGSTSTTQYDNGIPGNGVIIHSMQMDRPAPTGACFGGFASQRGWAAPIDATPGDYNSTTCTPPSGATYPNYELYNAQYQVGQTFTDSSNNVQVKVLSLSGNAFVVSIAPIAVVISADSVSPSSGTGVSQTFTFQYSDNVGATDLATTWFWFNASSSSTQNSCFGYYSRSANTFYLLNDGGNAWTSGTPGGGTLQNSQCGIALGASSATAGANTLTMKVAVSFTQAFPGAKNVYAYAAGSSVNSSWRTLGTWTVPVQCAYSIAPALKTVSSTTTAATVAVTAGAGCGWTAAIGSAWMAISSGSAGTGAGTVRLTFAANTTGATRTALATIAGQTFQLTQLSAAAAVNRLIWRHENDGTLAAWDLKGSTVVSETMLTPSAVSDTTWTIVGSGDFNGDGQPDLLWRNSVSGTFGVWYMNGTVQIGTAMLNPVGLANNAWKVVGVDDFNGDGHPDLLWRNDQTGELCVWYMNGVNLSSIALLNPGIVSDLTWRVAGVGDFNGDGQPDILWRSTVTGQFGVWLMNGVTQTSAVMLNPPTIGDLGWQIQAIGDLDGDGDADIVWQNGSTNGIGAWMMSGLNLQTPTMLGTGVVAPGWKVVVSK